jgi:hypothetical protein
LKKCFDNCGGLHYEARKIDSEKRWDMAKNQKTYSVALLRKLALLRLLDKASRPLFFGQP